MEEYKYGRDYIDPEHVKDEGITHEDCRRWKVLQELQVTLSVSDGVCWTRGMQIARFI